MKKTIIFLLFFIGFQIYSKEFFDINLNKEQDELMKKYLLFGYADVIGEGTITNIETLLFKKNSDKSFSSKQDINLTLSDYGKIRVVTKLTINISEKIKGNKTTNNIIIYIQGGVVYIEGKKYFQVFSDAPHSAWNLGDKLLFGVSKIKSNSKFMRLGKEFSDGYVFIGGEELQIPASVELIREIEEHNIESKLQKHNAENIAEENYLFSQSETELTIEQITKEERVNSKIQFVKKLKKLLRGENE